MVDGGLPETADPFELLGVDGATVDARGLKRAYAVLIKKYRPERAPAEFRRIRDSYEAAQRLLALRAMGVQLDHGADDDSARDDVDVAAAADTDADAGDPDAEVDRAPFEDPPDSHWRPVGGLAFDDDPAYEAVVERLHQLVEADDVAGLRRELESAELVRAASRSEAVEAAAVRALAVLAWDSMDRAHELYQTVRGTGDGYHHELYDEVRSYVAAYLVVSSGVPCPDRLLALLRLGHVAGDERVRELAAAVLVGIECDPSGYLAFLAEAELRAPVLLGYLHSLSTYGARVHDCPIAELPAASESACDHLVLSLEGRLEARRTNAIILACVIAVFVLGGISALVGRFSLFWAGIGWVIWGFVGAVSSARAYKAMVRPALLELARAHGVGPARLAQHYLEAGYPRVAEHGNTMFEDRAVYAVAAIYSASLDPDTASETYGDIVFEIDVFSPTEAVDTGPMLSDHELAAQVEEDFARERERKRKAVREGTIALGIIGAVVIAALIFLLSIS